MKTGFVSIARGHFATTAAARSKVEVTLQAFPEDEVKAMMIEGAVRVTCEFCKTTYVLDEPTLDRLYGES